MQNKQITQKGRHATAVERLKTVEEFRRSGLTRRDFSRQHGIARSTLDWWLRRTERDANLPAPIVFSEISLPNPIAQPAESWAMEFISPSGLKIRCREPLAAKDLVRLLKEA